MSGPPTESRAFTLPQALGGSKSYRGVRGTSCNARRSPVPSMRSFINLPRRCAPVRTPLSCSAAKSTEGQYGEDISTKKDPLKLFAQAQQNMMVLNQSRLKALEELKSAQQKIAELQEELESTKRELAVAQSNASQAETVTPILTGTEPDGAEPGQVEEPTTPEQPSPPPSTPTPQAPAKGLITIRYRTGWKHAYVHCNLNGKGWTSAPGIRMSGNGDEKELVLEGTSVEFVVNNGSDDWDTPDPFDTSSPKNYIISSPGVYALASGKLRKQG
eukprot:CAMPEP_0117671138 /NCGR_PEP_ID=MMETSP0804-20121206/13163_1 /TAXON_ID=1074897 /ORGANISM="Tetraselmis astigmatica, Strain CCMP880" /LENGTH=272 /DNA_ID=CAMNT_0005479557 /DNA_START=137 /DNA_END=955 /DNA_ORIENTATION=-